MHPALTRLQYSFVRKENARDTVPGRYVYASFRVESALVHDSV
jgi:hypothetical protein